MPESPWAENGGLTADIDKDDFDIQAYVADTHRSYKRVVRLCVFED